MTTAPAIREATAIEATAVCEVVRDSLEAVRRALAAAHPELVARVRARIQAYQAHALALSRTDFAHIIEDFSEAEVFRVAELLVDLGELRPSRYSQIYLAPAASTDVVSTR